MAKHPTPKQKVNRASVRSRYSTFTKIVRRKLTEGSPIVSCVQCKQPKVNHRVCPTCGYYASKKIVNMDKGLSKVTKIKA